MQYVARILDPIREEDAVEMVELVLHRAGAEAAEALEVLVALDVAVRHLDLGADAGGGRGDPGC